MNPSAPPTKAGAQAAAQSCLSQFPLTTFTPTSVPLTGGAATQTGSGAGSSSTGAGGGNGGKNSAATRTVDGRIAAVVGALVLGAVAGGMTLFA